ncbi:MAG: hypothetical protein F6J96_26010 [Symploca sp. SIO1C2]|nr:hypothetical protein [Symploca sp. SIO1C2]
MTELTIPTVKQISWVELANQILLDIKKIQSYYGEPIAAIYVDNLLRTMQTLRDRLPSEPYTEVFMALHDAMAASNRWLDYKPHQYQGVHDVMITFINSQLTNEDVEKAILALEELGFDTLPFGVGFIDLENDD